MKPNNKSIKKRMKKLRKQFPDLSIARDKAVFEQDYAAVTRRMSLAKLMGEIFKP